MFVRKIASIVFLTLLIVLLAACSGGDAEATAVFPTAAPQPTSTVTAVPPTDTPIPPTDTPVPPTPTPPLTPDITANFETFSDEAERVTFQYPSDWKLDAEEQPNDAFVFILTSGEDVFDLLGADDFSQPLGFALGEIRWTARFDSDDPSLILADWVEGSGLDMSPTGEVSLWQQDGVNFASQEFEVINADGDALLLISAVIVNGGRYGTFAYGVTAVGADEYAELAQAIFDSTIVHYPDPTAEPSGQTVDPLPARAPQFEGEMAIIVKAFDQYNLAALNMVTGQMGPVVAEDAVQPAWRPGFDDISYSRCAGDVCAIHITNRDGALVSDEGVRFQYGNWSPDGRLLAVTADPDGVMDIYTYDFSVEPPALTRLTADTGNNADPVWSDRGNFILFASDRDGDYEIYLMGADGSNQVPVTQNDVLDFAPALSPNSNEVAYVSDVNGKLGIFVFDFATRETRQLTDNAQSNFSPTWSPDGRTIAYLTLEDEDVYQLNIIPADGSGPAIPYPQLPPGPFFEIAWRPVAQEFAVEVVAVDFEDPANVLQAVFDSARLGDYSQLAGLCDPQGENDDDTAAICEITTGHEYEASFKEWFAKGQITGAAAIDGDRAEIPFTFGPEGDKEEMMTLIQRNGRWYLLEF